MSKLLNANMRTKLKAVATRVLFPIPAHISERFIKIDSAGLEAIEKSIKENYHTGWRSESSYSPKAYKEDLANHLHGRLDSDRRQVIPWLSSAGALQGKSILEIGCGTGSSTIALAEQGAKVTGIDIDGDALVVARDRAKVYGVDVEIAALNAQEMSAAYQDRKFDVIMFFACLEHMTISERLASLKDAWAMLPAGGLLVIVETPNRLWYFDGHTSTLPFYHWLPDELAFAYSKFSPRERFHELYKEYSETNREHWLRRGRGMSFHEIDLAIGPAKDLEVVSSLSTFEGIRYKLRKSGLDRRYKSVLTTIYPKIHPGFFDDTLFLIIRKQ